MSGCETVLLSPGIISAMRRWPSRVRNIASAKKLLRVIHRVLSLHYMRANIKPNLGNRYSYNKLKQFRLTDSAYVQMGRNLEISALTWRI